MKIQDLAFFVVLALFLVKRNTQWIVLTGILCILLSIPLFSLRIFFTAERLTWYAGGFFLLAVIFHFYRLKHE